MLKDIVLMVQERELMWKEHSEKDAEMPRKRNFSNEN
jgi:hypothetical protein